MKQLGVIVLALAHLPGLAQPPMLVNPLVELRHCGPPARDAHGRIVRSRAVLAAFQFAHPCPANGSRDAETACPKWQMDHVLPLVTGGCDAVWNLQWLPVSIKTCADPHCKDRFERKINAEPIELVP